MARFIGAAAVFTGVAEGGSVRSGAMALPADAARGHGDGAAVELFLRPEHVRLEAMNGHVPPGRVVADVCESVFLGSLTRVRVSLPEMPEHGGLWADVPSQEAEAMTPGRRVVGELGRCVAPGPHDLSNTVVRPGRAWPSVRSTRAWRDLLPGWSTCSPASMRRTTVSMAAESVAAPRR